MKKCGLHVLILRRQNSNKLMEQQIKDSKPAGWQAGILYRERRIRQTFPNLKNHTLHHLCLMVLAFMFCGCQSTDKDTALTAGATKVAFQDFFLTLQSKETAGTEELIFLAKEWRQLEQEASDGAMADTASTRKAHVSKERIALGDSIRRQMSRLINSRPRSLTDYLTVVRGLNDIEMDSLSKGLVAAIHRFYRNAGTTGIYPGSGKEVVQRYNRLLEDVLENGIHTKQDAFIFLKQEDVAFRSFLHHLPVLSTGNIPLGGITRNTGTVIRRIIGLVDTVPPVFGKSESVILLTMRNNRRLLQNAEASMESLKHVRIKDEGQAAAYLWMLLQPWITFDNFAYTLMDEEEWQTMDKLASKTPGALGKLKVEDSPFDISALPALLIEAFILG